MNLNGPYCCRAGERGSVLILALWIVFLLAMLAVAVGAHLDGRLALARRIEQRTVGYSAARLGVERGIARLLQETNGWDGMGEPWSDNPVDFSNVVSGAGAFSIFHVETRSDGGSNIVYGLWDEQSKIDVNRARVEIISGLLEVAGGLNHEVAAKIAGNIEAARTPPMEKFPALGGKTGWQDSHIEPGPLRSIHELKWIKGMSPEIFEKIREYVTVSGGNRVNLNTADPVVLQSLGMRGSGGAKPAESLSRKILQFRERGGIFKTYLGAGLAEAMGEGAKLSDEERRLLYSLTPYVTVASEHFRGHVEGWMDGGPFGQRRRVDFVWGRKERKFEFWYEE